MDDQQFDTLVRALAAGITRRGALGILAGLAGLEWAEAEAAKRRGRKKNKGRAAAQKNEDKVTICHRTSSEKNPVVVIEVDDSAVPAHLDHGDSIRGDCCVDSECSRLDNACNVGRCVVDDDDVSTCQRVPANVGGDCDDDDPCTENDVCDEAGNCAGTEIECADDGNPCTREVCRDGECVSEALPGEPCNDGDACTQDDVCDDAGNCAGEPVICPIGQACLDGECVGCAGGTCENLPLGCDNDPVCICFITTEGTGFCHRSEPCEGLTTCQSSADCANVPGHPACSTSTCCGPDQRVCIRPCLGTEGLGIAAAGGRTTGGQ